MRARRLSGMRASRDGASQLGRSVPRAMAARMTTSRGGEQSAPIRLLPTPSWPTASPEKGRVSPIYQSLLFNSCARVWQMLGSALPTFENIE